MTIQQQFIEFALQSNVLRFGEFKTKAGRLSPYFFNAGLFNTGSLLDRLGEFYAKTLLAAKEEGRIEFDMIFGPAYKGVPLAASVAINLSRLGCDVPWAFNRKEAKDHGEGGVIVGAPLKGKVVIIDDVISAGTSIRESVKIIQQCGAEPSGVLIALDRQERGGNAEVLTETSAVQDVEKTFGFHVASIITLSDLLSFMNGDSAAAQAVAEFRPAVPNDPQFVARREFRENPKFLVLDVIEPHVLQSHAKENLFGFGIRPVVSQALEPLRREIAKEVSGRVHRERVLGAGERHIERTVNVAQVLFRLGRGEFDRHALQSIGMHETVHPIEFPSLCAVIGRDDHGPDFLGEEILEAALRRGLVPVARKDVARRGLSEAPR